MVECACMWFNQKKVSNGNACRAGPSAFRALLRATFHFVVGVSSVLVQLVTSRGINLTASRCISNSQSNSNPTCDFPGPEHKLMDEDDIV